MAFAKASQGNHLDLDAVNLEEVKPSALVLGHSFVCHLKAFANKNRSSRNLNLEDTCRVFLSGIGGRTVDKLMQFDLAELHILRT